MQNRENDIITCVTTLGCYFIEKYHSCTLARMI